MTRCAAHLTPAQLDALTAGWLAAFGRLVEQSERELDAERAGAAEPER